MGRWEKYYSKLFENIPKDIQEEENYDIETPPTATLQEVIDFFKSKGIKDFSKVKASYENCYGTDYGYKIYVRPCFTYEEYELEETYQKRLDDYKREIKEYNSWYQENKIEIKKFKAELSKKKKEEKELLKAKKKKERLLSQQEKIKSELEGMK